MKSNSEAFECPTLSELDELIKTIDRFRFSYLLESMCDYLDPAMSRSSRLRLLQSEMRTRRITLSELENMVNRLRTCPRYKASYEALSGRLASPS